jgi:hypothetical protein
MQRPRSCPAPGGGWWSPDDTWWPRSCPKPVVKVVVFIVITVVAMDMWRHSATGRRKLRLAVLHRVLVVLVLEDLRGVLLVQRHRRFSCCFIVLRLLRRQELLVL